MKKYFFISCVLILSVSSFAQKGWRDKEMEVKVFMDKGNDAKILHELNLNGDIYSSAGYALMYVIPSELEKIKLTGLKFDILKEELNEYYADFWNKKAEQYHTYAQIISLMDSLATAYPSICKKFVLGTTATGLEISFLKISDNVAVDESEAEVAMDGGIHGDEVGGPENMIRFARYLCKSYGTVTDITNIINSREIFIYPMVNPYGRINTTRYNSNGIDCNRDFGYMWNGEGNSTAAFSQTETKLMRDFMYDNQFVTHVTYHSGVEEVIFPWCYRSDHAPDYTAFNNQAAQYSSTSGYASLSYLQSYADYPTNGELIDASYGINGTLSLTMEISTDKQTTDISGYFQKNLQPMIEMIRNSGYGVEGMITDSVTGNPVAAEVFVNGYFPVYSDTVVGDYHKFVLPGTYTLKIVANGYAARTVSGVVVSSASSTVTNIKMKPAGGNYIYKIAAVAIPNNNTADEANTPAVIGAPDNIYYSIGKNGWIIVDMQRPVKNITGNDFKIYEGDASAESYTCYASPSMDGPWTSLGTGTGTQEFDLAALAEARFIKIVDDGDGTATAANAGFDLDAIEVLQDIAAVNQYENNDFVTNIYPNPFNNEINLAYSVSKPANVQITFYNMIGEKVSEFTEENKIPGNYSIIINTSGFKQGVYCCLITSNDQNTLPVLKYIIK